MARVISVAKNLKERAIYFNTIPFSNPEKNMTSLFYLVPCLFLLRLTSSLQFNFTEHEEEKVLERPPCPFAIQFTKCGCELGPIGYVVECWNSSWQEMVEFSTLYGQSNLPALDFSLYFHQFRGDRPEDFSELGRESREKMASYLKSLTITEGENVTRLPDLTWMTSLEEVLLRGLIGLFQNDSRFLLPPSLKLLILEDMDLTQLKASHMDGLTNLTLLKITGYGSLELVGQPFQNLSALMELHIAGGLLTGLSDASLAGLDSLQVLNLSSNGLKDLPALILRNILDLQVLDIAYNDLTAIPTGWFEDNMELRQFRARWNDIGTLPAKLFDVTHQLVELDLSENYINNLPAKIFKNTSKLSLLNLRDNNLAQLQDGDFAYLNNLTDLDLGQNLLATLTRAFRGLNRLKKLNLTRNYIDHIANDAFRGLHSIQEIDLSRNRLTRLRAGMFHSIKGNLTLLDLSGNKIESVDKLALDGLRAIQLNLTGNALICSCQNIWIKNQLTSPTFCVDTRDMTVHQLADLTEENCTPLDVRFLRTSQEGLFFTGSILFLAGIFLTLGIVCVVSQRIPSRRIFYPSLHYDPDILNGSRSDIEIKTISTTL